MAGNDSNLTDTTIIISNDVLYHGIALNRRMFYDINLWAEQKCIQSHRLLVVIYFDRIRQMYADRENIEEIYFEDISHFDLEKLVEFMYSGRLSVDPPQMKSILETATKLKFLPFMQPQVEAFFQNNPNIMEKNDKKTSIATIEGAEDNSPPKLPKRKRIIPLSSDSSEVDADDNNSSENKSAKTEPARQANTTMKLRARSKSIIISRASLLKRNKSLKSSKRITRKMNSAMTRRR